MYVLYEIVLLLTTRYLAAYKLSILNITPTSFALIVSFFYYNLLRSEERYLSSLLYCGPLL